jgi:uncharacterized protein (DUF433 family)
MKTVKGKWITIDPDIVSGTPVFTGTRVPIQTLFEWLETESLEEFLENFPTVEREQAIAVLHLAEKIITSEKYLYEIAA